ncbi:MAG: hypothetical protein K6G83_03255 [Lachnospiraceae bacterium]|nr:hypothetical protein [Lachnospiraceae bacterium]
MKQKLKQFSGILLSLVLVLGLMPETSLTAYADETKAYGDYLVNSTDTAGALANKVVKFNNIAWYIIADDSTAANVGTVTLLAKDSIGGSKFHDSSNKYSSSTVRSYLDDLTTGGVLCRGGGCHRND